MPGGPAADYGSLSVVATNKLSAGRIRDQWADMLHVVRSLHSGSVAGYDLLRMLGHDGNPTPLGAAFADYGRAAKTLHLLAMYGLDDESYRRSIHVQLTVQESRHRMARKIFYGQRGELRQRYREGQEDQLGALGLVLNAVILWNTRYIDAALTVLQEQAHLVDDKDVARLSPWVMRTLMSPVGTPSPLSQTRPSGHCAIPRHPPTTNNITTTIDRYLESSQT